MVPFATITPPLDRSDRRSSICLAMRQLRSFSLAFRSSRLRGSSVAEWCLPLDPRLARTGWVPDEIGAVRVLGLLDEDISAAVVEDGIGVRALLAVTTGIGVSDDRDERAIWADVSALGTARGCGC